MNHRYPSRVNMSEAAIRANETRWGQRRERDLPSMYLDQSPVFHFHYKISLSARLEPCCVSRWLLYDRKCGTVVVDILSELSRDCDSFWLTWTQWTSTIPAALPAASSYNVPTQEYRTQRTEIDLVSTIRRTCVCVCVCVSINRYIQLKAILTSNWLKRR